MKVIAVGFWSNTTLGTKTDGDVFSIDDPALAQSMLQRGYVKEYEVKPHPVRPKPIGQGKPSTSSPAARPVQNKKKSAKPKTKAK